MRKEREVRERGFLIAILITACVLDLSRGRIPNGLCVAGWMISLLLHVMEEGSTGVRIWLTGGCLSFVIYLLFYILKAVGAGDVKLLSVVGSFLGGKAATFLSVSALTAGAVISLIHLIRCRRLISHLRYLADYFHKCYVHRRIVRYEADMGDTIPFSACILVAVLLWYAKEGGTLC